MDEIEGKLGASSWRSRKCWPFSLSFFLGSLSHRYGTEPEKYQTMYFAFPVNNALGHSLRSLG